MMDINGMTLEGFFLADYERLRNENDELKAKLGEVSVTPEEYGCFDLRKPFDGIKLTVESSYRLKDSDYGYTSEMLEKALEMDDDEFWAWCLTLKRGRSYCSSYPIGFEQHRYQYTLRFRETRSDMTLVTDGENESILLVISDEEGEDCLNCWQSADRLDYVREQAVSLVKHRIKEAIPILREKEEKAREKEAEKAKEDGCE